MITYKELQEKGICWTGYKRKKGTKPYEDGSCMKEELGGKEATNKSVSLKSHKVMAFGRMNPITSGHEAVVNKVHEIAKKHNADHVVIVSHSQDAKKNPLTGEQKVQHARNAFPGTNVQSASKEHPTILHHAARAHSTGAQHLHVVAGSDRHEEMHNLLHKYNGQKAAHGHYNFKSITVHSSGARDPDAEGTTGISASKMREHAASGNKAAFHAGAPSKMKPEHKDAMYNDVRKGMNIKEETVQEELRPDMGAGAYINDFIKSTHPKFNNKSKEERRKMAIGAYMAAKAKGVKESIDESRSEHARTILHHTQDINIEGDHPEGKLSGGALHYTLSSKSPTFKRLSDKHYGDYHHMVKHASDEDLKQMHNDFTKKVHEGVQIDELSTDLLARYKTASAASAKASDAAGNYAKGDKRFKGINKATNKQFDNDLKKHGQMKEGTLQGNIGGGDAMNTTTSAPSASTSKDTTMGKKIKGFKFFNGENDKQMNMNQPVKEATELDSPSKHAEHIVAADTDDEAKKRIAKVPTKHLQSAHHWNLGYSGGEHKYTTHVKSELQKRGAMLSPSESSKRFDEEVKKEDPPFDGPYKSTFKKPNNPNRTGMDSARSLAQRAIDQLNKKKPVKEEVELEEGDLTVRTLYNKFADAHVNGNDTKSTEKVVKKVHGDEVFKHMKKAANANAKGDMDSEERHFDNAQTAAKKTDRIGGTVGRGRSEFMRKRREWSEEVELDEAKDKREYGYEGDMAMNQLKTLVRCAEMIEDCLKPDTDLPEWVQSKITLATDYIQTAADYLYSEAEVKEGYSSYSGRSHGHAYGGGGFGKREREDDEYHVPDPTPVAPVPDRKYIKGTPEHKAYKATKKPINGHPTNEEVLDEKSDQAKQNKTMKNMMDASRGARYKLNNPVPDTDHKTAREKNVAIGRALRNEATAQKGVNVDDVNAAGQEPHEEKWEPAKKTVSKLKKVKEENMKSYKEFLQSLDEKLVGKQKKLDKNHNGELDKQDFEMLRKEETERLVEYETDANGVYRHTKKATYGTSYVDPEGADETAADLKKKEKKAAGRKTGQRTGSYKPRATMSKLKAAGATYK